MFMISHIFHSSCWQLSGELFVLLSGRVYGGHHSDLSAQCSDLLLQLDGNSLREQNDEEI